MGIGKRDVMGFKQLLNCDLFMGSKPLKMGCTMGFNQRTMDKG